jgi:capsular polysaccharide biosynthesis protein
VTNSKIHAALSRTADGLLRRRTQLRGSAAKRLLAVDQPETTIANTAGSEPVQSVNAATTPPELAGLNTVYSPPLLSGERPQSQLYRDAVLFGDYPVAATRQGRVLGESIFRTNERYASALQSVSVGNQLRVAFGRSKLGPARKRPQTRKPLVSLHSRWNSFGHWIPEHLLKLYWLQQNADLSDYHYLVEKNPPTWKLQLLNAAGIKTRDLVYWDREYYRVETLLLPDYPEPSREALDWVRALVVPDRSASETTPGKIYVSRKYQQTRQVSNEEEVERALKAHGFSTIYPERLSLSEQADLFSHASSIIGPQGSAFTNQIFAYGPFHVVEFFGASRIHLFNRQVALVLGHTHAYTLDARNADDIDAGDTSVLVDITELEAVIEAPTSDSH